MVFDVEIEPRNRIFKVPQIFWQSGVSEGLLRGLLLFGPPLRTPEGSCIGHVLLLGVKALAHPWSFVDLKKKQQNHGGRL